MIIEILNYTVSQKKFPPLIENRLKLDKVTESLKVGTLLRHSVEMLY